MNLINIFLILILVKHAKSDFNNSIYKSVEEIKQRSISLYGNAKRSINRGKHDDSLAYPRGDKQKLSIIAQLWRDYYDCSVHQLETLTPYHRLPSEILMVFEGAVVKLPCNLCVAPGEGNMVSWVYAQSLSNLNFTPIEDKDRLVREEDGNITMYHVTAEDAGVYRCQIGRSVGGLLLLELVDDTDNYNVVKPSSSLGPYPTPATTINGDLILYTSWMPWSECSLCGKVGRRRRNGVCFIKIDHKRSIKNKKAKQSNSSPITENKNKYLDDNVMKIFDDFPAGIPCRSQYLPITLSRVPAVVARRNEIMIGMCKVPCKKQIFEVRSDNGRILERTNNSAGIYSVAQKPPSQPPLPVTDIVFAACGLPIVIKCSGTTLRDIPVTWRVGPKVVVPRDVDKSTGGRIHINARDHLVFSTVRYEDDNLYSCWQDSKLAGTVKLVVWEGAYTQWKLLAGAGVLLVAAVLSAAGRMLHHNTTFLGSLIAF